MILLRVWFRPPKRSKLISMPRWHGEPPFVASLLQKDYTTHMSWRELITGIHESQSQQAGIARKPEFRCAASAATIADAENILNAVLPISLRSLLLESDGVMEMMAIDDGDWFESIWLLWNTEELVEQNCFYRAASKKGRTSATSVVFFAAAGTDGILFGFPVEKRACASRIVVWHPIADELNEVAPTLEDFL